MVSAEDWPEVAEGLLKKGVCGLNAEEDVRCVGDCKVFGGLFGVSKEEWRGKVETYRLIMNLVPLNTRFVPLTGDLATLLSVSQFVPLRLGPEEILLTSSEDVRCMFYIIALPSKWRKYLAFPREVPSMLCPQDGRRYYLCSNVLPMGFVHSVAIAQHIHRNVVLKSGTGKPQSGVRSDKGHTVANPIWRVYLDNFDEIERVSRADAAVQVGTLSPGIAG